MTAWDSSKEVVTLDLAHYDHLREGVFWLNELALLPKHGTVTLEYVDMGVSLGCRVKWLRITQGENMWQGCVSSIEEGIAFLRKQGD